MMKNIIFDLGGVLVGLDGLRCIDAFNAIGCERVAEYVRLRLTADLFLDIEEGTIDTEGFCAEVRRMTGCTAADSEIIGAWNQLLTEITDERKQRLKALRRAGYKVYLLSNTNDMHWQYTKELLGNEECGMWNEECGAYFDRVFLSYRMHLSKPDVHIFEEVLRQAGLRAEETLFIDDNRENIQAAASLGIQTYLNTEIDNWLHEDGLFE
ncbi:MAG: HAD family phosphatase [Prevotella sp.]|nr:HAD family phosphatase [Prevotella sp.]